MSRTVPIDLRSPEGEAALADAVRVLRRGGLVAFPTETVYGLGGRALDEGAIARIFAAKGRPTSHPLIAHVSDEAGARGLAGDWTARASRLAQAFWPGPLTLVVPRAAHVPAAVAGGGDSIAIRAPAHPVARALIALLGEPIAAPSANRYQGLSPTRAEHVAKSLGDRVDLILDGGPCDSGIESTVVDVRGERPRVLRPGALSIAALRQIEPDLEVAGGIVVDASEDRASPGMDARHYAPRAPISLVVGRQAARDLALTMAHAGTVGLVLRGGGDGALPSAVHLRMLPDAPDPYAAALFATLHALDDAGVAAIVVEAVPDLEAWLAVADRLRRAST